MTPSPTRRLRRHLLAPLLLAAVALLLAACGEKSEDEAGGPERFDLALDYFINPDHAPIYSALDAGYFEQAGLDVRPVQPADPAAPIKQVAAGTVDLAISYEPEVLLAVDQGLDVIAIGALVQEPLTSLISLPEKGIEEPADLEGKTVVTAGIPYQTAYLEAILGDAGVDIKDVDVVNVGTGLLAPVKTGRADAMFGGFRNFEGVLLELSGDKPRVEPADRLGIPTYDELVLVANKSTVEEDPEKVRLFIAALERGMLDAQADPDRALEVLLDASPELDREETKASLEATLPLFTPPANQPFGWMDPSEWVGFSGFMADQGQIATRLGTKELLTNDLLPTGAPAE